MIGFILRTVLTLSTLFFTVWLFARGSWGWGITMILPLAVLILSFFRHERIILALNQMRMGNTDKAYIHLKKITAPQMMIKRQQAYYYYLIGMLGAQENGLTKSEQLMRKALQLGLRSAMDQAVAHLHLAGMCLQSGRKQEGLKLLDDAKRLDKDGMLSDQIKTMKKQATQVASKNQMRMMQLSGGKMRMGKPR
jgi:tetratricopeptide (TPR) repeat protein